MKAFPDFLLAEAQRDGLPGMRAASKVMTLLENEPELHGEFLKRTGFKAGPELVLGITGPPGSGKSTLTDALLAAYRTRFPERRMGVIAVDPSSPISGGALLADRVRMMRHATDPHIFVRSMASRGHLGGLALGVRGVLSVMAWMGLELVIIETVGVGQSEVEIVDAADEVAVVLAPGFGDSLQLLKAGLMEIADILVINKADTAGSETLHAEVLAALQFETKPFQRDVALVSATEQKGIPELIDLVENRTTAADRRRRRTEQHVETVRELLLHMARQRLLQAMDGDKKVKQLLCEEEVDWNELVRTMLQSAAQQQDPDR